MKISLQLSKLRESKNLSREKFADIIGVSPATVREWESGTSMPDINHLYKIAEQFHISADTLLFGGEEATPNAHNDLKKILPDYGNELYLWEAYSEQMATEYRQSFDEGLDIERYKGLFTNIADLPAGEIKEKMTDLVFQLVQKTPVRENYPYREPSDYHEIRMQKKGNTDENFIRPDKNIMLNKMKGAWYGRIAGCLLGKPIEGMRRHELLPFLKQSGNYPMHRYIVKQDVTNAMTEKFSFHLADKCYADTIDYAPADDDTNYMVLAGELIDRFGLDFKPQDVLRIWTSLQSKDAYFTAERIAFKNYINGYVPPDSAIYKNVYREWIGAQIRGDYFGYINPGAPEKAAEMAWRDASVSHIKNGIYGEMLIAAMLSGAAVTDDIERIITVGLNEIPEKSRLHEAVTNILDNYKNGMSETDAFADICNRWNDVEGYDWCHTVSNAEIVTAALLYGNGNYGKSICLAVQTGFDTDCNGATVGSIIGMAKGFSSIDEKWTAPIGGKLHTGLFAMETVCIDRLIDRCMMHAGY